MKKQKKPWLRPDNPWIVGIAALAALVTVTSFWPQLSSMFGQKTESKPPLWEEPNTVKLKIKVTDIDFSPLKSVDVNIDSSTVKSKLTNSDGYVDFDISKKSAQVSITMSKDGYESDTKNVERIDENDIQKFALKKKR